MNLADTHALLTFIAVYDNRKFDDATVVAWQPIFANLALEDCRAAAVRHFGSSTEYLMPAHIRQLATVIRDERKKGTAAPLALPGRFEKDPDRDVRIVDGIVVVAERWKLPEEEPTDTHGIALQRARRERGKRPVPGQRGSRVGGRSPKMPKLAGPSWANPDTAEQQAIQLLHESGKVCGRRSCLRCQERQSA